MSAKTSGLKIGHETFTEKQRVGGSVRKYSYQAWALRGWINDASESSSRPATKQRVRKPGLRLKKPTRATLRFARL